MGEQRSDGGVHAAMAKLFIAVVAAAAAAVEASDPAPAVQMRAPGWCIRQLTRAEAEVMRLTAMGGATLLQELLRGCEYCWYTRPVPPQ
jgi:hypothetical protein